MLDRGPVCEDGSGFTPMTVTWVRNGAEAAESMVLSAGWDEDEMSPTRFTHAGKG
ncbi:MAG: hypothetical protein LBR80_01645 [Deltaproteobacteria bacterium]|jgi:hypothetical protein|nr:hypothetical protein [Deltaproteobacteria bacterium]